MMNTNSALAALLLFMSGQALDSGIAVLSPEAGVAVLTPVARPPLR